MKDYGGLNILCNLLALEYQNESICAIKQEYNFLRYSIHLLEFVTVDRNSFFSRFLNRVKAFNKALRLCFLLVY